MGGGGRSLVALEVKVCSQGMEEVQSLLVSFWMIVGLISSDLGAGFEDVSLKNISGVILMGV